MLATRGTLVAGNNVVTTNWGVLINTAPPHGMRGDLTSLVNHEGEQA